MNIDKSKEINILIKGLAIISVVAAHCSVSSSINSDYYKSIERIMRILGCIGVPVFFIISGYAFSFNKKSLSELIKNKFINLGIPWIISGVLIQLVYVFIYKNNISIIKFIINSLFGNAGSYYIVVLFMYYFIIYFINYKTMNICFILISIVSQIGTSLGIIKGINPYYNLFNWLVFFEIGYIIGKNNFMYIVYYLSNKYLLLSSCIFIGITIFFEVVRYEMGYWSIWFIPYAILAYIFLVGIANVINKYYKNLFIYKCLVCCGKNSFFIYLFNFIVATFITKIFTLTVLWRVVFLSPIIVVIILNLIAELIIKLLDFNVKGLDLRSLIGIR